VSWVRVPGSITEWPISSSIASRSAVSVTSGTGGSCMTHSAQASSRMSSDLSGWNRVRSRSSDNSTAFTRTGSSIRRGA